MGLSETYIRRPAGEETINDPTNNRHYWRFRIHVYLEDLLADKALLSDLQVPFCNETSVVRSKAPTPTLHWALASNSDVNGQSHALAW